jgi:AcrR family transcriptional regulator
MGAPRAVSTTLELRQRFDPLHTPVHACINADPRLQPQLAFGFLDRDALGYSHHASPPIDIFFSSFVGHPGRELLFPSCWTVNREVGRSCAMASARTASFPRARLGAHLAPRRRPVQERARKTVELILDTAAALIEEAGVEAFNTNVLAERAGVRVRTVYRYFPNKLAVVTAVAERLAEEWDGWFEGFRELSDPRSNWRTLWVAYMGTFVEGVRRVPGGLAIRRAMRALPELQAVDRQDNERLARQLAAAIERRGVVASRGQLTTMARIIMETAVTVLDLALLEPQTQASALIEELKHMHLAYMEPYIEGRANRRR